MQGISKSTQRQLGRWLIALVLAALGALAGNQHLPKRGWHTQGEPFPEQNLGAGTRDRRRQSACRVA